MLPDRTFVAFAAAAPDRLDVFALADALRERGWYVDRQSPPPSLHCTVMAGHAATMDAFLADVDEATAAVLDAGTVGDAGAYGTIE